jgi:thiol-disulfide isomerase/thioredoxin
MIKTLFTLFFFTLTINVFGQVEVSGTVHNLRDTAFYITESGGFDNFTRVWRDNRVKVVPDSKHNFKIIVPESSIGSWYISTENSNQLFDLIKGESLKVVIDFSAELPVNAAGTNASDFNYSAAINAATAKYYSEHQFAQKKKSKNIDSVLVLRKQFSAYKVQFLKEYRGKHKMSDAYYHWLLSQYDYEPYERIIVENVSNDSLLNEQKINKLVEKGVNDEYAALHTSEYNDLVDFYVRNRLSKISNNPTLAQRFDYVTEHHLLSGSTKDVYLSRFMAWLIKTPDSLYQPLFNKYNRLVHNKALKQLVINRRNDYVSPLTSSAFNADNNKQGSLIDIFKRYKGKVIYVDFWASWCIPCRVEMPNSEALRNRLRGKPVVFVYFGYKDKETAWLKARKQLGIEGEHYLLTKSMIQEADSLFGINGIPHYAIIDKEGKLLSRSADRPGSVYDELLKTIDKVKN